MRRVLLTVHKFFPEHRAGTEVLTLKVGQELMRRGYDVKIVTANPPDTDARHAVGAESGDYVYEGLPVHVIGESLRLKNFTFEHEFYHPEIKSHFKQILAEFKPDLLHIFHAQNLSSSIIEAATEAAVPVVCSTTDFWFVCPVVQLKRPDGSVCRGPEAGAANCLTCYTPELMPPKQEFLEALSKKYPLVQTLTSNSPSVIKDTVEGSLFEFYKSRKWPAAKLATEKRPNFLKEMANRCRCIMVPTKLMRDIFIENGINAELIQQVPFGIDTEPLTPYQEKTPSSALRIGFIGTLFEHKGPDLLIQAFQELPENLDVVLKIYGDLEQFPEYGQKLRQMVQNGNKNNAKISFLGTFPNADFGSILQNLDVLVVPSRWYENTPLVIQSALATKTPLIVTNLGGMAEIVKHEFNGLVFTLNSVSSLKEQLLRVAEDRSFWQSLRDNIAPERTVPQMVDDIEAVYETTLKQPTRDTIAG
ncbi:MAG: glycosyltransferase [Candidatus Obscuribacterales bacterium]|nr:glycosyltransferase [Candidatus Obscuribacterales bacterium]